MDNLAAHAAPAATVPQNTADLSSHMTAFRVPSSGNADEAAHLKSQLQDAQAQIKIKELEKQLELKEMERQLAVAEGKQAKAEAAETVAQSESFPLHRCSSNLTKDAKA